MGDPQIPTEKNYKLLIFLIGFVAVVIGMTFILALFSTANSTERMMILGGAFVLLIAGAYVGFCFMVHS